MPDLQAKAGREVNSMADTVPQVGPEVGAKLRQWQKNLLDLSKANRLLYHRTTRTSCIPIREPSYADLYELLVVRGRKLRFASFEEPGDSGDRGLGSQDSLFEDSQEVRREIRRASDEVACPVPAGDLLRSLYNLRSKARLSIQEQGFNVLYLALGFLQWLESEGGTPILSPIVLVPVVLERQDLKSQYTMGMFEDDVVLNPTLEHKLARDFRIQLDEPPGEMGKPELEEYFRRLPTRFAQLAGWVVKPDASLGIYSFQKLALYKDLEIHGALFEQHPIIRKLAKLPVADPPITPIAAEDLDEKTDPVAVFQVLDADSSQQEAIEVAKQGGSFILQGPPGTGKSQTIANIIAESLAMGRKVLFVSAKMAALEVVHRRLSEVRLADYCLQLHSHKRDKREVVAELLRAMEAPSLIVRDEAEATLH